MLAVSMGDPAGIGPEIIAKAWAARDVHALAPFFAIGDARAYPDAAMGWRACEAAHAGEVAEGSVGAGAGAATTIS